jgi:hypothetical protein
MLFLIKYCGMRFNKFDIHPLAALRTWSRCRRDRRQCLNKPQHLQFPSILDWHPTANKDACSQYLNILTEEACRDQQMGIVVITPRLRPTLTDSRATSICILADVSMAILLQARGARRASLCRSQPGRPAAVTRDRHYNAAEMFLRACEVLDDSFAVLVGQAEP